MKLPNGENAIVDRNKLLDYSLNQGHVRGRHKARVFLAALGITADSVSVLEEALRAAARDGDATIPGSSRYGVPYRIDFDLTTAVGSARVRSGWIVLHGEHFPRLTTAYVLDSSDAADSPTT